MTNKDLVNLANGLFSRVRAAKTLEAFIAVYSYDYDLTTIEYSKEEIDDVEDAAKNFGLTAERSDDYITFYCADKPVNTDEIGRIIREQLEPLEVVHCVNTDNSGRDYKKILFCCGGPCLYAEMKPCSPHFFVVAQDFTDKYEMLDYDDELEEYFRFYFCY